MRATLFFIMNGLFKEGDLVAVYRYFDPYNVEQKYKKKILGLVIKTEDHVRNKHTFRYYRVLFVGTGEVEPRWLSESELIRV
jgi:hypothetical protein